MKNYTLETIIKGKSIKFDKKFNSRNAALNYAFRYLSKQNIYNTEITNEYSLDGNKHNICYATNDDTLIHVNRIRNYTLEAIINGKTVKFDKAFNSRNAALKYAFEYLNDHYFYNTEVVDEYSTDGNKHHMSYICNDNNILSIDRV